MIRWEDKDPGESIVVEFDFASQAEGLTGTPTIMVQVSDGTLEPAPDSIKSGGPTISGTSVLQRLVAGVAGVDYFFKCTATSTSGDTLTLEAAMLVKARPVVSNLQPRYITRDQFESSFGETELTDLESNGNSFAERENQAASEIDGYLAVRYTLPLLTVPALVRSWAGDITRYKLWDERAPQEVKERYERAITQLEQLAKGLIALPPDASGTPATPGFTYAIDAWDRVFTEENLQGF